MRFQLKEPMILMSRVEGPQGVVRELSSLLDPNFGYSVIFSRNAIELGYPEASYRAATWRAFRADRVPNVSGLRGIEKGILVTLAKVSVGNLVAKDVDAVVLELDLARTLPVNLILGQTFLKNFKLSYDFTKSELKIEESKRRPSSPA